MSRRLRMAWSLYFLDLLLPWSSALTWWGHHHPLVRSCSAFLWRGKMGEFPVSPAPCQLSIFLFPGLCSKSERWFCLEPGECKHIKYTKEKYFFRVTPQKMKTPQVQSTYVSLLVSLTIIISTCFSQVSFITWEDKPPPLEMFGVLRMPAFFLPRRDFLALSWTQQDPITLQSFFY